MKLHFRAYFFLGLIGYHSIHFSGESEDDDINEVDEFWIGNIMNTCLNAIFDMPAIFYKILQKLVKSQHAMFSNSRQKGEVEDNNEVNELWIEPINVKERQF